MSQTQRKQRCSGKCSAVGAVLLAVLPIDSVWYRVRGWSSPRLRCQGEGGNFADGCTLCSKQRAPARGDMRKNETAQYTNLEKVDGVVHNMPTATLLSISGSRVKNGRASWLLTGRESLHLVVCSDESSNAELNKILASST